MFFLYMNEKNMLESTNLCLQIKTGSICTFIPYTFYTFKNGLYGSASVERILKLLGQVK